MIRFAENLNKMIEAGLGGATEAPSTEVAVGSLVRYMDASGPVANFETNVVAPIRSLRVDMRPIQEGSGDPSPTNIRPFAGRTAVTLWRESEYDPSADPAIVVQLGETIYCGTVDVTGGKISIDRKLKIVDSVSVVQNSYIKSDAVDGYVTDSTIYPLEGYRIFKENVVSDILKYANTAIFTGAGFPNCFTINLNQIHINIANELVGIADYTQETAETAKTKLNAYLAEHPVTLTIPVEPFEIAFTPAQLFTLRGDNNVWSDAGDVTLEYPYYEETEGY